MTWIDGEIITASRMADLDTQRLVGGDVIFGFDILKIANTNIFATSGYNSGAVTYNNTNGTVKLETPQNSSDALFYEFSQSVIVNFPPRIGIFRVSDILYSANSSTSIVFGFADTTPNTPANCAAITTNINVSGWNFTTRAGGGYIQSSTAPPVSGDTYIMYLSSSKAMLFKNGVHNATHSSSIPSSSSIGRVAGIKNGASGYILAFDFMR